MVPEPSTSSLGLPSAHRDPAAGSAPRDRGPRTSGGCAGLCHGCRVGEGHFHSRGEGAPVGAVRQGPVAYFMALLPSFSMAFFL